MANHRIVLHLPLELIEAVHAAADHAGINVSATAATLLRTALGAPEHQLPPPAPVRVLAHPDRSERTGQVVTETLGAIRCYASGVPLYRGKVHTVSPEDAINLVTGGYVQLVDSPPPWWPKSLPTN